MASYHIESLIETDMRTQAEARLKEGIRAGYAGIKAGRYFKSSGNFHDDMKVFEKKQLEWGEGD